MMMKGGGNVERHETDVVSLAFAAIFITIGAVFLSGRVDAFDFVTIWAMPVTLVATGLLLGAVAVVRYRRIAQGKDAERNR